MIKNAEDARLKPIIDAVHESSTSNARDNTAVLDELCISSEEDS